MSVSEKQLEYIANLARLTVPADQKERLLSDMNNILAYIDQLNELDTTHVEPLVHVIDLPVSFRRDEAKEPLPHTDALKNAPDADSDYFRVPKVIE
jgi:aspartyl-tRNA(Asn)/glutamyl-tRNA(Gln) amidotransferase subunit C